MNDRIDVLIVGAGPAGVSAALHLLRAEKRVVLVDAGKPRSARANHLHGFPTRDGIHADEMRTRGLEELARYEGFTHHAARVDEIARRGAGFVASLSNGASVTSRRVLLATGVVDVLLKIPGLEALWGHTIFDCPYCHGHELAHQPWAVLNTKVAGLRGAVPYTTWSRDLIVFTNGVTDVPADGMAELNRARILVETRAIVRFHGEGTQLTGIEVEGGDIIPRRAMVYGAQGRPSDLALMMGLALGPDGFVRIDPMTRETSMKGVLAAGDLGSAGLKTLSSAVDGMYAAQLLAHALTLEDVLG